MPAQSLPPSRLLSSCSFHDLRQPLLTVILHSLDSLSCTASATEVASSCSKEQVHTC